MKTRATLFEKQILNACIVSGAESSAAGIYKAFESNESYPPNFSRLYMTIDRLVKWGCITETKTGSERSYTCSPEGWSALLIERRD